MYNNTSKILPSWFQDCLHLPQALCGVVLPHSDKLLSAQDIDKKIENTKKHIFHLTQQLPNRATHGGKRFRARVISLQDQISLSTQKFELLQMAKTTLTKLNPAKVPVCPICRSFDLFERWDLESSSPLWDKA
jgi:hypothetical protein